MQYQILFLEGFFGLEIGRKIEEKLFCRAKKANFSPAVR